MDRLTQYRIIIQQLLTEMAQVKYAYGDMRDHRIFDREADSYAIITQGWDGPRRIHNIVVHLEIINGKIWIQENNTEQLIADQLEAAGVPKTDIVLGFQHPSVRQYTEYAAA